MIILQFTLHQQDDTEMTTLHPKSFTARNACKNCTSLFKVVIKNTKTAEMKKKAK